MFGRLRLVARTERDGTDQSHLTPVDHSSSSMSLSTSLLLLLLSSVLAAAQYQCNPDAAGLRQSFLIHLI